MIFTERTITVVNDSATINKPLILYRGDKNVELKITIAESQFKFRNTDASNVIETTDASYAQLVINTPYGLPIFSDVAATKNGAVIFVITEAMVDEIREVGAYEIQIRLLDDNKQSRASIPPVSNAIEIREPIAIEDGSAVDSNAVNVAKVNRALTTTSAPLEAFDSQGNYIKKTWGDGDPITDAALNKIEAGIDGVNKKIANNSSQIKDIEHNKADLQKVKELIADAQLEGTEVDTSLFIRKSQLDNISLQSANKANPEDFLIDKKILAWDAGQHRDTCIDSVAQPGWIVFNEVECKEGDVLFVLNNTEKLLAVCNIFSEDGSLSRAEGVSEISGVTINAGEKYIRLCYNNESNKDLNLFQIKKSTDDLSKFEPFGNVPILSEQEKSDINTKLNNLDTDLSKLFNTTVNIVTAQGLYNTLTKEEQFNDNASYVRAQISVNGGDILYITATDVNWYNFKAYIILDGNGNIIASCEGKENGVFFKGLKVEIPVNGRSILLNSTAENGIQVKKFTKTRIDDIENEVAANKAKITAVENKLNVVDANYENDVKRFTRTQLKNPFKYKAFDKAYVTFAFDDGTNDLDKIASIFKEFGYPMCMSLPPDSLNTICVGLQSESNGYTVNMTVKDVAKKVVEEGGEVLCHSWTPITLDNINDKALLTETFISNVKVLRNAGFEVNGIITAGGPGALDGGLEQGGDVFQYWASIEFDYSDLYGFTEDYYHPRMNLGDSLDMNKTRIDDAINHNKWIVFFGHALQDSGNYTEQNLRAILQYCKERNITVVPYKYIYNTFK